MAELSGCWLEADRADNVATELLRIRNILSPITSLSSSNPSSDYETQTAILRHVEQASRLLRDLHDLFPIYRSRVPLLVYDLTVLLPLTDLQATSDTWLARHSRHRVWVKDLHIYVFCDEYRRRAQVKKHGEFELYFVRGAEADDFIEVFNPIDSDSESEPNPNVQLRTHLDPNQPENNKQTIPTP
ncbi:hypothetical protein DID88_001186 [Monilinia fructigena]|uniref:PH domain-containing protein n=1 Tax=Monilinia fructigena TaxID=38457 RepID=A0A395J343_9HELO|nr:hypothetical protein DID88_001186 [Monilinia fructigena]